jgi:hypothetical protein
MPQKYENPQNFNFKLFKHLYHKIKHLVSKFNLKSPMAYNKIFNFFNQKIFPKKKEEKFQWQFNDLRNFSINNLQPASRNGIYME